MRRKEEVLVPILVVRQKKDRQEIGVYH